MVDVKMGAIDRNACSTLQPKYGLSSLRDFHRLPAALGATAATLAAESETVHGSLDQRWRATGHGSPGQGHRTVAESARAPR